MIAPPLTNGRITTVEEARGVMRLVCRTLNRRGGIDMGDGDWIAISLKSPEELAAAVSALYCLQPRGLATYSFHGSGRSAVKSGYRIAIERDLPYGEFAACCAHELGHIWQFRAGVEDLPPFVSEGLCELFKLTWYIAQGPAEGAHALRQLWSNADPVYGEGFRSVLPALLDRRLCEVMEYVAACGHLPPVVEPVA